MVVAQVLKSDIDHHGYFLEVAPGVDAALVLAVAMATSELSNIKFLKELAGFRGQPGLVAADGHMKKGHW